MVRCSPERHGAMTGVKEAQIDPIPLAFGAVPPTELKTLALMRVYGGLQSFNAVAQLCILWRWVRCITIPNQSSVPKAFWQFDDNDSMLASSLSNQIITG